MSGESCTSDRNSAWGLLTWAYICLTEVQEEVYCSQSDLPIFSALAIEHSDNSRGLEILVDDVKEV